MFKCYDDIQCVNIPYVDIGEYKTYILNSVIALFKIIINTIILFIWWGITISILCSVGLCELSKYCEIGTGISDIIYRMTLKISTAILNFIHNIYPEHDCKATIIDRGTQKPYLERHYLLLKNREVFPFNVFLHKFIQGDNDDIHDHPWDFFHIILSGGYWEYVPKNMDRVTLDQGITKVWRRPGYYNYCTSEYKHRIILGKEKPWTLFIPFKRVAKWGFWVPLIWQDRKPCIKGTTVNGENLNVTQWRKIPYEKYLNDKYATKED